ncbi:MAG: hypothetical protein IJ865_06145 [Clostridia bacterium]|nr:hypothetical protein [Clostridia bacterium]
MRTVRIIDTTLKAAETLRGATLTFREKLEIARSLDRLKVDAIEMPALTGGKADTLAVKTIVAMVSGTVSGTVDVSEGSVEDTWSAIRDARHPRINVTVPVSPVQMEYSAHKKAPALVEAVRAKVRECRNVCEDVEITCQDATRAEKDFLCEVVSSALEEGANHVTLCDTAGVMMPGEFADFVSSVRSRVAQAAKAEWYVQVHNGMNMAAACAAQTVAMGVDGVKCCAVAGELPTLSEMAQFVRLRGNDLGISTGLRTTELQRIVEQIDWQLNEQASQKSSASRFDLGVSAELSNICLDAGDEIGEVVKVVRQLGYDLSEEDNAKVYEAFRRVAAKKSFVGTKELDAIVASTAMQVPATYRLESYVINSGNVITATANLTLEKNGEKLRGVSVGDGPIDAAFLAIEQIIGHHYELDDFQIQAVTEGHEAMGHALVRLRSGERLYSGNGISTDIIGASIRAYISALNKIVYEEV